MAVRASTREPLTRQRVLQAGLRYVDEHGLAGLSMHKLGAELGVKGMSLYNHVDGKEGLLDGIVEIMWTEVDIPAGDGGGRHEDVRSLARALRDLVHRHPKAAPLLMARQMISTHALAVLDGYLRRLQAGGLPQQRAVELMRTVLAYGFGFALAELTWMDSARLPDQADDDLRRYRHVTAMTQPDTPDHLLRAALLLCTGCDMNAQFDLGIDLMLRGLDTAAEPSGATTPG